MSDFVVCALYKFVRLEDYTRLRSPLLTLLREHDVRGTLLLAREGINGTVAGSREGIDALLAWLKADPRLADTDYKESYDVQQPFNRTKVKLKKEIVTLGVPEVDPTSIVGTYVKPKAWNAIISDPEVLLIDTRNDYEVQIGTFKNAVNPKTDTFREFPQYIRENVDPAKYKKVAMFCTGGIRCEKSTSLLKLEGFDEVYHLKGGILKYLEEVPKEESLWEGECFVFDGRVSVDHDLNPGTYEQCNACRMPINAEDMQSEHYVHGVSCPHCIDKYSDADRARFRERELQIQLARTRGESHVGGDVSAIMEARRQAKKTEKERQRARRAELQEAQ